MKNYKIIYKCRRCKEIFIIKIPLERNENIMQWMEKNIFGFHSCEDEKGIGITDLIGNGEIVTDK